MISQEEIEVMATIVAETSLRQAKSPAHLWRLQLQICLAEFAKRGFELDLAGRERLELALGQLVVALRAEHPWLWMNLN